MRGMPTSVLSSFTVLLSNFHSICLHIQNRDFILSAEKMTNSMAVATRAATDHLLKLDDNLKGLSDQALSLERSLFTSFEAMEKESKSRQDELLSRWQVIEDRANALEARQDRYEASMMRMIQSASELADTTDKINLAVNTVVRYEQKAERAMAMILGRRVLVSDVIFYASLIFVVCVLSSIPIFRPSAPPLLLVILATITLERNISSLSNLNGILGPMHMGTSLQQGIRAVCLAVSTLIARQSCDSFNVSESFGD